MNTEQSTDLINDEELCKLVTNAIEKKETFKNNMSHFIGYTQKIINDRQLEIHEQNNIKTDRQEANNNGNNWSNLKLVKTKHQVKNRFDELMEGLSIINYKNLSKFRMAGKEGVLTIRQDINVVKKEYRENLEHLSEIRSLIKRCYMHLDEYLLNKDLACLADLYLKEKNNECEIDLWLQDTKCIINMVDIVYSYLLNRVVKTTEKGFVEG